MYLCGGGNASTSTPTPTSTHMLYYSLTPPRTPPVPPILFPNLQVGQDYFLNTRFLEGGDPPFSNVYFGPVPDGPCGEGGMLCPLGEAKR